MYSHDTYGLGHIRRTMAIADRLRARDVNVLILTGSPIAGRFSFPENVDFVRIPGMIKKTNDEYRSLSIRIDPDHALTIRKSIIQATAEAFGPDLFIVDKEPLGLKREVLPTLRWLRKHSPHTRTILGLRDIMDHRDTVRRDWEQKEVYTHLADLYSEIWIYGRQDIYDAITEYAIPDPVRQRTLFTGYLARRVATDREIRRTRKKFCASRDQPMIVVTTGGGGDGYHLMDVYMRMLEEQDTGHHWCNVLITGPFMPRQKRRELARRGRNFGIKIRPFYPCMEELFAAADLVVSMGGYNTICEILSQKTRALIIPRDRPRQEQLIRARAMKKHRLIDYIPWDRLDPTILEQRLRNLLEDPTPFIQAMDRFQLNGVERIKQRVSAFRNRQLTG